MSFLYAILAILGLGFLIFIHELGHYFMARKVGMRVEAFSIGFGKPIFSWMRNGVKWQIGSLPFGGYVRIAGMQKEGNVEPSDIPDGFFGKNPWQRIQVAFMGPLVNIVFALLAFGVIWVMGGREKPFSEFTHRIGMVDPKSELYQNGVRPGDELTEYAGRPYTGIKDLLYAGIQGGEKVQVKGYKIDYFSGEKYPFEYHLAPYESAQVPIEGFSTLGISSPAEYLLYEKGAEGAANPIPEYSPMKNSGIEYGDRLLWVDGELVFSQQQLRSILSESTGFLTIQRGNQILQTRVPRIRLDELNLSSSEKYELEDWQYEANLQSQNLQKLYFLPYTLSSNNVVQKRVGFLDEEMREKAFLPCLRCSYFTPLEIGDKIIALDGKKVSNSYQLLRNLQTKQALIIVERNEPLAANVSWKIADSQFDRNVSFAHLEKIVESIGTDNPIASENNLQLLAPVAPKPLSQLSFSKEMQQSYNQGIAQAKKEVAKIKDPKKKAIAEKQLNDSQNSVVLGLVLQDQRVNYNPNPLVLFADVFQEMKRSLSGLVGGSISPKYMIGPVGIIHAVQKSWAFGSKEAIYWLALISLNLGLLNLLPVPVLDGGHIVFALFEMVTKRPIKAKTMERMVLPFVLLLVGFFIYITYHDLSRIVSQFL